MSETPSPEQLQALRNYFNSGATRPYAFRKVQLQNLKAAILRNEQALYDALHADLKKSPEESWVTETGFLIGALNATL
jgi:aldehyde dehydrogenase (NAD+)